MNEVCRSAASTAENERKTGIAAPADAVTQNLDIIRRYKAEYVVILAGNHIYKQRLLAYAYRSRRKRRTLSTVACMPVPIEEASALALWRLMRTIKLSEFVENLHNPPSMPNDPKQISEYGYLRLFDADYLYELLEEDDRMRTPADFGKDLIPKITEAGLASMRTRSRSAYNPTRMPEPYWRDVGTLEAY